MAQWRASKLTGIKMVMTKMIGNAEILHQLRIIPRVAIVPQKCDTKAKTCNRACGSVYPLNSPTTSIVKQTIERDKKTRAENRKNVRWGRAGTRVIDYCWL